MKKRFKIDEANDKGLLSPGRGKINPRKERESSDATLRMYIDTTNKLVCRGEKCFVNWGGVFPLIVSISPRLQISPFSM